MRVYRGPRPHEFFATVRMKKPFASGVYAVEADEGLIVSTGTRSGALLPWSAVAHYAIELAKACPQARADILAALAEER